MTLRDAAQQALEVVTRFTTIKADDGDDFMVGYPDTMVVRTEVTVADLRAAQEAQAALRAALAEPERRRSYSCTICAGSMVEDDPASGQFGEHREDCYKLTEGGPCSCKLPKFDPATQSEGAPQTAAKPQPTQVACRHEMGGSYEYHDLPPCEGDSECEPIYLCPPREWQSLTDRCHVSPALLKRP